MIARSFKTQILGARWSWPVVKTGDFWYGWKSHTYPGFPSVLLSWTYKLISLTSFFVDIVWHRLLFLQLFLPMFRIGPVNLWRQIWFSFMKAIFLWRQIGRQILWRHIFMKADFFMKANLWRQIWFSPEATINKPSSWAEIHQSFRLWVEVSVPDNKEHLINYFRTQELVCLLNGEINFKKMNGGGKGAY